MRNFLTFYLVLSWRICNVGDIVCYVCSSCVLIKIHLIQGVTWDPVGSYIATQSDDKTVKIWKTLDWKLEATISKPFEEVRSQILLLVTSRWERLRPVSHNSSKELLLRGS